MTLDKLWEYHLTQQKILKPSVLNDENQWFQQSVGYVDRTIQKIAEYT